MNLSYNSTYLDLSLTFTKQGIKERELLYLFDKAKEILKSKIYDTDNTYKCVKEREDLYNNGFSIVYDSKLPRPQQFTTAVSVYSIAKSKKNAVIKEFKDCLKELFQLEPVYSVSKIDYKLFPERYFSRLTMILKCNNRCEEDEKIKENIFQIAKKYFPEIDDKGSYSEIKRIVHNGGLHCLIEKKPIDLKMIIKRKENNIIFSIDLLYDNDKNQNKFKRLLNATITDEESSKNFQRSLDKVLERERKLIFDLINYGEFGENIILEKK